MNPSPFPSASPLLKPLAVWFDAVRRDLPWRARDLDALHPDPYAVLVSELMLQQTQVRTVIPYFQRWMDRFPDPASLAGASDDAIHGAWQGLGYYRRARHLQAAAAAVALQGWPRDLSGLMALPGLGPYTAAALASIAFQRPEAALDGNAFRVLARLLGMREDPRKRSPQLREWLRPALEVHGPSRLTQAIMELGALVCGPAPDCQGCPLGAACEAHRLGITREIPPRMPRAAPREIELTLLALEAKGAWLLHPPRERGLLAGLWRWPSLEADPNADPGAKPKQDLAADPSITYGALMAAIWPGWTQVYSHRREHVRPITLRLPSRLPPRGDLQWVPAAELRELPMGRRDQRMRELIEQAPMGSPLIPEEPRLALSQFLAPR